MLRAGRPRAFSLPRSWPRRSRAAAVYAVSIADNALTPALGWAADSLNSRHPAELVRLRREISLLREEIRIKDARMEQIEPHRRPYYPPLHALRSLNFVPPGAGPSPSPRKHFS